MGISGGNKETEFPIAGVSGFLGTFRLPVTEEHVGRMGCNTDPVHDFAVSGAVLIDCAIGPTGHEIGLPVRMKEDPIGAAASLEHFDHTTLRLRY